MQTKITTSDPHLASRVPVHLQQIATDYRLRVSRDECSEVIIRGRTGHIYAYDDSVLAVLLFLSNNRAWTYVRRKLVAAGFRLLQDCDTEGTATFDPQNPEQANLAIKVTRVKRRRRVSPATAALLASFSKSRRNIAGRPVPSVGPTSARRAYISSGDNQVHEQNRSTAMKSVQGGGAD